MPRYQKQITTELNTLSFSMEINKSPTVISPRILQYPRYIFIGTVHLVIRCLTNKKPLFVRSKIPSSVEMFAFYLK